MNLQTTYSSDPFGLIILKNLFIILKNHYHYHYLVIFHYLKTLD